MTATKPKERDPFVQEMLDRRERERLERWNGDRPLFDTAYTKGDFKLAEPGCECWSKTEGGPDEIRRNHDGDARGGIILEVTTSADENGEVRRAFRCFDYYAPLHRSIVVLQEHQVDPDSFTPPNWARVRGAWRRICREIGTKRGTASISEIDLLTEAHHLAVIVGRTLAR